MKIRLNKSIIIFIIIFGFLIFSIHLYYTSDSYKNISNIYELIWKLKLPSNLKLIYHNENDHGFHGDGLRYSIYSIDEKFSININQDITNIMISEGNSNNGRNYSAEEFINKIASDLKIPKSNIPIFEDCYYWYKLISYDDTLFIVYFPNTNKVFFVEKLV